MPVSNTTRRYGLDQASGTFRQINKTESSFVNTTKSYINAPSYVTEHRFKFTNPLKPTCSVPLTIDKKTTKHGLSAVPPESKTPKPKYSINIKPRPDNMRTRFLNTSNLDSTFLPGTSTQGNQLTQKEFLSAKSFIDAVTKDMQKNSPNKVKLQNNLRNIQRKSSLSSLSSTGSSPKRDVPVLTPLSTNRPKVELNKKKPLDSGRLFSKQESLQSGRSSINKRKSLDSVKLPGLSDEQQMERNVNEVKSKENDSANVENKLKEELKKKKKEGQVNPVRSYIDNLKNTYRSQRQRDGTENFSTLLEQKFGTNEPPIEPVSEKLFRLNSIYPPLKTLLSEKPKKGDTAKVIECRISKAETKSPIEVDKVKATEKKEYKKDDAHSAKSMSTSSKSNSTKESMGTKGKVKVTESKESLISKYFTPDESVNVNKPKSIGVKETPYLENSKYQSSENQNVAGPSNSYTNPVSHTSGVHTDNPRVSYEGHRNSGFERSGLNGLRNIGNTCFMNSVIQCLSNTKPLLEYLINENYVVDINTTNSVMKGCLIKMFSHLIQELWAHSSEDRIINTMNFKSQVQRFAPRFTGYSQQDAQEFLRYLLEGLHEDVNRVTIKPPRLSSEIGENLSDEQKAKESWKRYLRIDNSRIVDIFVGQLKSTLRCTVCGHCSVTFDPFWDLSLPIPTRSGEQLRIQTCLDAFTREETLDGDEKPTCEKCKTKRKCTKSFSLQKFPNILVLHLKRFSPNERYRGKLSVVIEFPLNNLDLSPYAATRGQTCNYNLYAVSNHSGTTYSGHYTAYCKHPYTGNWHEYNDSKVSSLSSRSVVSGEAYVLFYELSNHNSKQT